MELRTVNQSNYPDFYNIFVRYESERTDDGHRAYITANSMIELLKEGARNAFLFYDDSALIGFTLYVYTGTPESINYAAVIQHFGIDKVHRGKGKGTEFATSLIERFKADGIYLVNLVVEPNNIDASAFWEKIGIPCKEHIHQKVIGSLPHSFDNEWLPFAA